ncbi:MAG: EamA/RhaT family transporter [Desulfobacteraceae bacterium]|nr:MAG: EamA/RhaT family transporter [Desulfobacteraceae bacterium]
MIMSCGNHDGKRSVKLKGYSYIVIAACLWGILGPISRFAFEEGVSPLEVAFWRALLAWGCFGIHAVLIRQVRIARQDLATIPIFGITGVAMFYGFYQLAIQNGGAAMASVLLYTAPAWVAVMAAFLFQEKMTWKKGTALFLTLIGIVGVSLAAGDSQTQSNLTISASGILFGLLSGFCYSLYYIFGKHFSGRYSAPNLFLYILPIGALALFPFVSFAPKSGSAWISLLTLAVVSTYAAYYFYYLGLQHLEASRASITATLEPVVAAMVAFFWWKEYFGWTGYAGSLLILTAVIIMIADTGEKTDTALERNT